MADTAENSAAVQAAQTGGNGADAAPTAEETARQSVQPENLQTEFETLIRGKYKQPFDRRMQEAIKGRLKNAKETEAALQAAQPVLRHLAQQYGVAEGDMEGLLQAVTGQQGAKPEEGAGKLYDIWLRQEQETRNLYPAFSMEDALRDSRFRALLRGGADVRTAYEAVNVQRIIPAAMALAAKMVEERVARRMAAAGARPDENAMGNRAAGLVKADVSRLSRSDIEDVSRRVARGERISFG